MKEALNTEDTTPNTPILKQKNRVRRVLFVYLNQGVTGYITLRGQVNSGIRKRPQLGFQYLAAVLENIGVDSLILDQSITPFTVDELARKIISTSSDIVGFYSASVLKHKVMPFISGLKRRVAVPIIVGGPDSASAKEYLDAGCDIVCNGEGEVTICNIADYYNGKKKKSEIKGISYLESGRFVQNPPQDLIDNLDYLPFPKRDKIPLKYYYDYYIITMEKPYVTMMASRGCPMNCTFCTSHLLWRKRYRVRSVENVLDEIEHLKNTINVKYIAFLDDIFGLDEAWLRDFCTKLIRKNYDLKWMCILHPFSLRNSREELLGLLRKSGCDTLSFGLQSAHPEILKNIKRYPQEPQELEKTIGQAKKEGFLTAMGIIFGLPGETKDTIRCSIDYCCRVRPTYAEFYNLDLLDGSEIAMTYKKKEDVCGINKAELDNWCRYAARKFYGHPYQVMELARIIITKNPFWLWIFLKNMRYFIKSTGFN